MGFSESIEVLKGSDQEMDLNARNLLLNVQFLPLLNAAMGF
jgi:hypothetical protein